MLDLDKYQKEAVYSKEENLLIVAPPGSGKTTVIINRIFYLINSMGVEPKNIVVITFTKAAANSMKNRYINMIKEKKVIDKKTPFFGTLHGLFYKILKNYYGRINIIEERITYKLIDSVLKNYLNEVAEEKIKEVINDISKFKVSGENLENFQLSVDREIFNICYSTYEEYKKEKGLIDFDDLEIKCKHLLVNNKKILKAYRNLFKYVLVDEFQDCDFLQLEILKLLNEGNSIFAVGDEDQCIYGFRGARPDYMVKFEQNFNNGKKKYLKINYRSPENIVNMSNNLILNNEMRNKKEVVAIRKSKDNIQLINTVDENSQAFEINNILQKLIKINSYDYTDIAILYRTNLESRSLIDEFIRKKVPFKILDKNYNFFEHFICKDLLAYLKLSINNRDKESFLRIINKPFRYIGKISINKIKNHIEEEDWFEYLKSIDDVPIFQLKVIDQLKRDINYLNRISLDSAISYIVVGIGYNEFLKQYSNRFKVPIEEVEAIVEEFKLACKNYKSIIEFLVHVEEVGESLKQSRQKEKKGVVLSTIHGIKGMEFKNVFIINCNEDTIPHHNSKESIVNLEEERRLFYVGITRAIDNLWVCTTETMQGSRVSISRFIEECSIFKNTEKNKMEKGDVVVHKVFGRGEILEVGKNYLNIMFSDNVKRKFDTMVVLNSGILKAE